MFPTLPPDFQPPSIDGFVWSAFRSQCFLNLASAPGYAVARICPMEDGIWHVSHDFHPWYTPGTLLRRAELDDAIAETMAWATTYREKLLRREHSGAPRRHEHPPRKHRKRSARRGHPL